jgi:Tol biopolymer transport system component/tRNA A-37 threonylcarbamoyl transferase component Bud32
VTIRAGQSLLHYRIAEKVGAGGMGEVYRAEDTRLGRDVAIKVLPAELREDPNRLARLEREARMLASLNHPHVATVHGLEQAEDGTRFLVMELVEGESLAARLERGPLPLTQVYDLGARIAEALGAAHACGIVHRDLKPANIMLTRRGIKLLDFGLAKEVELPSAGTHVATRTLGSRPEALTGEGAFVGTFQYTSPEQLEGQEADPRADVFALGAVIYEMATGRKAFQGKSTASLIAAILSAERPSISRDLPLAPPALDRLVRTCLAREPDERWQSARDVGLQLGWIAEGGASSTAAAPEAARRGLAGAIPWAIAAVALGAAAWLAFRPVQRPASAKHAARFPLSLQGETSVFTRVSPDGRHFGATIDSGGRQKIWLRSVDELEPRPLQGTEGAWAFFWSPDSRSVGFVAEGKLKKLTIDGGSPEQLCDAPGSGPAQLGAWGRDGTILFGISEAPGHEDSLYRVSADGGTPEPVRLQDEAGAKVPLAWPYWPSFLPDGRHFLSICEPTAGQLATCVTALESGRTRRLLDVPSYAEYAPPGYLLYTRRGVLVAQAFDLDTLSVRGEPSRILDRAPMWVGLGIPFFSASNDGVLVYDTGAGESRLTWKDRNGVVTGQVGPQADYEELRIAPDGGQVAVSITDAKNGSTGIWLIDVARNVPTRFTLGENDEASAPVWSPDGRSLAFVMASDAPPSLHLGSAAGGAMRELVKPPGTLQWSSDWSPDGRFLLYADRNATTDWDLWVLPLDGKREPFPLVRTRYEELGAVFSPDGRWVAYVSNETGQREVYVQRFPEPGDRRRVSTAGGSLPRWPRKGRELFYVTADDQLMAVPAVAGASLELGTPVRLFHNPGSQYDVSSDGRRFLVLAPLPGASTAPTVVLDWTAELPK